MKFHCLVSTNPARKPLTITVEASDEAEAAFACWRDRRLSDERPMVAPVRGSTDRWTVSDGHRIARVCILRVEEE